jgi:repressor LexA
MKELDEKYLAKLRTHWKRHAAFPSMAKLCETVGLTSTSSVFALVGRLVDAGYLERVDGRIAPTRKFFARPLLSPVRAGQPQPASQEEPELLTLDDYLIDDPNRTSLHKVRGDSMKDAGILEGDLVVVEHHTPTKPGDIVVVWPTTSSRSKPCCWTLRTATTCSRPTPLTSLSSRPRRWR